MKNEEVKDVTDMVLQKYPNIPHGKLNRFYKKSNGDTFMSVVDAEGNILYLPVEV